MTELVVHPGTSPLRGVVAAPASATMLQLALTCAAVAERGAKSELEVKGCPPLPVVTTLRSLGVTIDQAERGLTVTGVGLDGLTPSPAEGPGEPSVLGALLGLLAPLSEVTRLLADAGPIALQAAGAARALRKRGAQIEGELDPGRPGWLGPPWVVGPAPAPMSEVQLELAPREPAAKAALLTSGLMALGDTFVHEPVVSDDRLERLLASMGVSIETLGPMLRLSPPASPLRPLTGPAPGDAGLSVAVLAAALASTESQVGLRGVGVSPGRSGWLEGLRDAGVTLGLEGGGERWGQPVADIHVAGRPLRPLSIAGERGHRAGVPLPLLAALAAFAPGESVVCDVPLSHPAQLPQTLRLLQAFGIPVRPVEQGLAVTGGRPRATTVEAAGEPTLAIAAAILALGAEGPCRITGAEVIGLSFPRFVGYLRGLGATVDVNPDPPAPSS